MPKEVTDIKKFLHIAKGDAQENAKAGTKKPAHKKVLIIKQSKKITKFKLRGANYLYTFKTADKDKAQKLTQSIPNGIQRIEVKSKKVAAKKKAKK